MEELDADGALPETAAAALEADDRASTSRPPSTPRRSTRAPARRAARVRPRRRVAAGGARRGAQEAAGPGRGGQAAVQLQRNDGEQLRVHEDGHRLEETGVAAYKGQAPNIKSDAILAAALSIHSVEARHTAWIRDIAGLDPAPVALDPPATKAQTLAMVARTGFIVGPGRYRRRSAPPFIG